MSKLGSVGLVMMLAAGTLVDDTIRLRARDRVGVEPREDGARVKMLDGLAGEVNDGKSLGRNAP